MLGLHHKHVSCKPCHHAAAISPAASLTRAHSRFKVQSALMKLAAQAHGLALRQS